MTGSDAGQQLRDLVRSLPQETTRQISAETLLSVVQEKIEPEPSKPRIESVTDDSEKPQEKIAPKADKATAVNGGKFMYTGTDKPLGVVFGGKGLYLENDCLVTNFPECGALMLDGVSAKWNGILLEESAGKFLACAPEGKDLTWEATDLTVMTLITCVGTATPIVWGAPYYARGWVTSLMATVSCKGTLTWRGKQFTVGQNRHKGMYGSAWIEGLQDDAVNPSDFPGSWRTTLQSTGLPDGTTDNKFMLELKFVEFLRLEGERPLKAFDQVVVTRRLRKLTTKFGQAEVDSVYKSPK